MPAKNSLKADVENSYYHIYSRGVNRAPIFNTEIDYVVFLSLLKRYLSLKPATNNNGEAYPHLHHDIELLAFCLMPNHFHLLVYQSSQAAMQQLMRGVLTSYSMYFNKKYKRSGPLFEGRYKATLINSDTYLLHISRYIHLNPKKWRSYAYSSLGYYQGELRAQWVKPDRIIELFGSISDYLNFLEDYEAHKQQLDQIKTVLAGS